ncbi:ribose/xylose/arabinose/galactoside ABC-type transport system permease subunit [Kaistia hirudinis]|uniref:Ribose/xylose/arabinose/galactoside ABC-type transport system permease subunit n=1 Tax=Kaistia hirudinis TaxID=1293440 RepID=A0A840AM87_9HYPH|nr:ABC transporter permease [Kaistia hirudinis]MBB3930147.1 ribose/xylose/arabinose/galactoside ABC-type transport system permease subunit [Kaistia hirudinis]
MSTAAMSRIGATSLKIYAMEVILLILVVFLIAFAPGFATLGNFLNVLRTVSMLGIIAFGMTAVIISGEIDLSIGATAGLAGCIVAFVCDGYMDMIGEVPAVLIGTIAALAIGFCTGVFTGKIRQWFNVPTFITTLALFTAIRGIANLVTGGFPMPSFPSWFYFFGAGNLFGVPFPVYVLAVVFVAMHFLMKYTSFGRAIYAVGGNAEAARLSGIDVSLTKTLALAITGALAALSGILLASQVGSGIGTMATGMELDVISATIIGGTSLFGGKGRIWGTLLGVLFLGCIANGMTLMNVSEYWQYVVRGGIILGAVLLNQILERIR